VQEVAQTRCSGGWMFRILVILTEHQSSAYSF
jgi:hypothetical protein